MMQFILFAGGCWLNFNGDGLLGRFTSHNPSLRFLWPCTTMLLSFMTYVFSSVKTAKHPSSQNCPIDSNEAFVKFGYIRVRFAADDTHGNSNSPTWDALIIVLSGRAAVGPFFRRSIFCTIDLWLSFKKWAEQPLSAFAVYISSLLVMGATEHKLEHKLWLI